MLAGRRLATVFHWAIASVGLFGLTSEASHAQIAVYPLDLYYFKQASPAASIRVDFENVAPGTDITGWVFGGVRLEANTTALQVVNAAETYSGPGFFGMVTADHRLFATSGTKVVSPGGVLLAIGPNTAYEDDGLDVWLNPPVKAFGIDVLSQSCDGMSTVSYTAYDAGGAVLSAGGVSISALPMFIGGASFFGLVSDRANIARVVFTEHDADRQRPNSNVGYDTIRIDAGDAGGCVGDLNSDGFVDDIDFVIFAACYDAFVDPCGDFTGDGFTDDTDFVIFAQAYDAFVCP